MTIPLGDHHCDLDHVDSAQWSVIYLKPDAVERHLEAAILGWIAELVAVSAVTPLTVTREQIFAHYGDMFSRAGEIGVDVAAELVRIHVGRRAVVALGLVPGTRPTAGADRAY